MLDEIDQAVEYVCQQLLHEDQLPQAIQWSQFKSQLRQELASRYSNHWFPEDPERGCAYRCIHCTPRCVDSSIVAAAAATGVDLSQMLQHAPSTFYVWVDPGEVSARTDPSAERVVVSSANSSRQQSPASPMLHRAAGAGVGSPLQHHQHHQHHQQTVAHAHGLHGHQQLLMMPAPQVPMHHRLPTTTASAADATTSAGPAMIATTTAPATTPMHMMHSFVNNVPAPARLHAQHQQHQQHRQQLYKVPMVSQATTPPSSTPSRHPPHFSRFAAPYHPGQHQAPMQVQVQH